MAEIYDRSMIFGIRCHMSIHVQLYAYMTLISENMTQNTKNEGKMQFFKQKCKENKISNFNIITYMILENDGKMILK